MIIIVLAGKDGYKPVINHLLFGNVLAFRYPMNFWQICSKAIQFRGKCHAYSRLRPFHGAKNQTLPNDK